MVTFTLVELTADDIRTLNSALYSLMSDPRWYHKIKGSALATRINNLNGKRLFLEHLAATRGLSIDELLPEDVPHDF